MNNITEERIDNAINSTFLNVVENFMEDFEKNSDGYYKIINDATNAQYSDYASIASSDFAALKTAMDYCVEIMRVVLKELLCDESATID